MLRGAIIPLCISFVLFGCEKPEDISAVKKALTDDLKTFTDAVNKKDIAGTMASYWNSPELVAMYPDSTYKGYDALKASWERVYQDMETVNLRVAETHVEVGRGIAYRWGYYTYSFKLKGGSEVSTSGRFTDLLAKKDGKWVIVVDHASLPMPPPPPPAARSEPKAKRK